MTILDNPDYQIQAQSINADGSLGEYYKRYVEDGKQTFNVVVADKVLRESVILALQENGTINPAKLVFVYEEEGKLRICAAESAVAEVQVFSGNNFIDALEMNSASASASPASDAAIDLFDREGGHSFRPVAGFAHPLLHQINLDADLQHTHHQTCPSGKVSTFSIQDLMSIGRPERSDSEILAEQINRRTR